MIKPVVYFFAAHAMGAAVIAALYFMTQLA